MIPAKGGYVETGNGSSSDNPYSPPTAGGEQRHSDPNQAIAGQSITTGMVDTMEKTQGWARFLAVLLFVGAGFLGLFGAFAVIGGIVGAAAGFDDVSGFGTGAFASSFGLLGAVYFGFGVLYFFLGRHLIRFGRSAQQFASRAEAPDLQQALLHQQRFWKMSGIVAIVGLSVTVLGMVLGVLMIIVGGAAAF